jgi:hypothetical protein
MTTSLVLTAGVAQAEVTFSSKIEVGISRTEKTKAVKAVVGTRAEAITVSTGDVIVSATPTADGTHGAYGYSTAGLLTYTDATDGTPSAATADTGVAGAASNGTIEAARVAVLAAKAKLQAAQNELALEATDAGVDEAATKIAVAQAVLAAAEAAYAKNLGTAAAAAVAAGDMKAYSGYDLDVAVSSTLDNGMVLSAAFDMGAGSIADRDDDRILDAQAAAVALSTVTVINGGVTYVIGQDKIDDLYDDDQSGDVSVSGTVGGISYTLVTDLDKDTKKFAAKYTA